MGWQWVTDTDGFHRRQRVGGGAGRWECQALGCKAVGVLANFGHREGCHYCLQPKPTPPASTQAARSKEREVFRAQAAAARSTVAESQIGAISKRKQRREMKAAKRAAGAEEIPASAGTATAPSKGSAAFPSEEADGTASANMAAFGITLSLLKYSVLMDGSSHTPYECLHTSCTLLASPVGLEHFPFKLSQRVIGTPYPSLRHPVMPPCRFYMEGKIQYGTTLFNMVAELAVAIFIRWAQTYEMKQDEDDPHFMLEEDHTA